MDPGGEIVPFLHSTMNCYKSGSTYLLLLLLGLLEPMPDIGNETAQNLLAEEDELVPRQQSLIERLPPASA